MEPSTWRLILTEPAHGDWNMAVDEAILESVGRRVVLPTLRLFSWQPPCDLCIVFWNYLLHLTIRTPNVEDVCRRQSFVIRCHEKRDNGRERDRR